MMQTEIKIVQYNVSGQVVAAFNLDLYDNVPIPVNKSIIDIKEPQKRKSDYTLPITVPGTANNRSIFSNIQNLNRSTKNTNSINFSPDFNVNLKAEALVIRGGIILMRGNMQLTQIPIQDEDVEFELVIIGKLANLFQDLGDKKLSDISLSEFDHTWNSTNIANSWSNNIIKNGNAYNNFNVSGDPNGEGYVYPLIDNGLSTNSAELEYELEKSMYPAIYVKQIVDKIFSEAGYRYQSNFFESRIFKKLIVPCTSGKFIMTEQEVSDRTWEVTNSADLNLVTNSGSQPNTNTSQLFPYGFDTITKNTVPTSVNTGSNIVTIPSGNNGKYRIGLDGSIFLKNVSGLSITLNVFVDFKIVRNRGGVITTIGTKQVLFNFVSTPSGSGLTKDVNYSSNEFDTLVGDEIYVEVFWRTQGSTIPAGIVELDILSGFGFYSSPSSTYNEGQLISINAALPQEVKQADFLSYLFKMFNLYAVADKIDENKLIIEPRDDFYTNDVVELTNNLDVSSELMITPMGDLDFRRLEMSYKEDKDEYNKKYQDLFRETYSTKRVEINNDFLTETKEVKVGFSATPLASASSHDRIYTKIRMEDPPKQDADLPSFNIRILIYGGLLTTTTGWSLKTKLSGTINYAVDFPYAGMLDNPLTPTFDLGWAQPKAINYGLGNMTYTNGNLFNRFWKKNIDEITDKDSKIVAAKFKLNEVEFNALSFQKIYLLKQQYYRLYTVKHDLNSDGLVDIELLKLKAGPEFTLVSGSGNGGSGSELSGEDMPMFTTKDNGLIFTDEKRKQTTVQGYNDTNTHFLPYSEEVAFIEDSNNVILPDANLQLIDGVQPIIRIKNINGGSVKIFPIEVGQTINSANSHTLQNHHAIELIAYKGKWQIINTVNTGGG